MENQNSNKITLRITKDEIYFNCEGYSEEFINAIKGVIDQKRRSLIEVELPSPQQESPVSILKPETKMLSHNRKIKAGRENIEKNKKGIIDDIEAGMGPDDIKEKYGISSASFYRLRQHSGNIKNTVFHKKTGAELKHKKSVVKNRDSIIADIKNGLSFPELKEKYGISSTSFYRYKEKYIKSDIPAVARPAKKAKSGGETVLVPDNAVHYDIGAVQSAIRKETEPRIKFSPKPDMAEWQNKMIERGF